MHQRGFQAKITKEKHWYITSSGTCVVFSQFLTGSLLIRARYRQDCVRREEVEDEGEEDVETNQSSEKHQEDQACQGDCLKGAQN